jgi:hypothetical protein
MRRDRVRVIPLQGGNKKVLVEHLSEELIEKREAERDDLPQKQKERYAEV